MVELAERIEGLLYDEESEDDDEAKEGGKEEVEGDEAAALKSILMAVDLSWERIGLMERRGFKVISKHCKMNNMGGGCLNFFLVNDNIDGRL